MPCFPSRALTGASLWVSIGYTDFFKKAYQL